VAAAPTYVQNGRPIHVEIARPISGEFRLLPALDELLQFDLLTFGQIVLIDLTLSGDNAIIIGLAAAGLPAEQRRRAIAFGILGATLLRVLFASMTYALLEIVGLTLAGGILLLWVTHKMWRETRAQANTDADAESSEHPKTLRGAIISILVADVSMSLDNVLAVAGAAHGYPGMLLFGESRVTRRDAARRQFPSPGLQRITIVIQQHDVAAGRHRQHPDRIGQFDHVIFTLRAIRQPDTILAHPIPAAVPGMLTIERGNGMVGAVG
jgi:YjbE family integral membrane protein